MTYEAMALRGNINNLNVPRRAKATLHSAIRHNQKAQGTARIRRTVQSSSNSWRYILGPNQRGFFDPSRLQMLHDGSKRVLFQLTAAARKSLFHSRFRQLATGNTAGHPELGEEILVAKLIKDQFGLVRSLIVTRLCVLSFENDRCASVCTA